MGELHRHACVLELRSDHCLGPSLVFVVDDVVIEGVALGVVSHIQQTETHLTQTAVAHHEVAAVHDAADKLVGQRLAGLIMVGKGTEEFLLYGIVFHKLGRQFDEVPPHVGTRETLEAGVGKHAVERVTKFVQEGLHLAQREQCRLLGRGLGKVHDQ